MERQGQILNAKSNLLGIALIIIAALNVTRLSLRTLADEVAWGAAVALMLSCLLSYLAIRRRTEHADMPTRYGRWADRSFVVGLILLFVAVLVLASASY